MRKILYILLFINLLMWLPIGAYYLFDYDVINKNNLFTDKHESSKSTNKKTSKKDVDLKDNYGWTQLMRACDVGDIDKVNYLISQGADVNAKQIFNYTPLIIASMKGYAEIVTILLNSGANINAQTKNGDTALMLAAENNHINAVKILLNNKAEINYKDTLFNETALMKAVKNKHFDIAKLIDSNYIIPHDIINNTKEDIDELLKEAYQAIYIDRLWKSPFTWFKIVNIRERLLKIDNNHRKYLQAQKYILEINKKEDDIRKIGDEYLRKKTY